MQSKQTKFSPEVVKQAATLLSQVATRLNKVAFTPSEMAQMAAGGGGEMPMDPAMMGGGGMPMDPAMMGGMPQAPAAPGVDMNQLMSLLTEQQQPKTKSNKVDPEKINIGMGRILKLLTSLYHNLGWPLPSDILDDEAMAKSVETISQPEAQSASQQAAPEQPAIPEDLTAPALGMSPPITPIEPIEAPKTAGVKRQNLVSSLMAKTASQKKSILLSSLERKQTK